MPEKKTVTIVGAGIAGLSAAVALAASGRFRVTVLERRPVAGGRASSHPDGEQWIDNCQHVLLGCCGNLIRFYRMLGVEDRIQFFDTLYFMDRHRKVTPMGAGLLPPPAHLLPGLLRFPELSMAGRLRLVRTARRIARSGPAPECSFGQWLRMQGEPEANLEFFWTPVVVSALNAPLDRVACAYAFLLFQLAFFGQAGGYKPGIPIVPLASLYTGPARDFLEQRGGELRLEQGVRRFVSGDSGIAGVVTQDETVTSDYYVSALPPRQLLRVLPSGWEEMEWAGKLKGFQYLPILSAHFWLRSQCLDLPFVTVLGSRIQWIFNRSRLSDQDSAAEGQRLEIVVSAADEFRGSTQQEVADLLWKELKQLLRLSDDELLRSRVIRQMEATFVPDLTSLRLRLAADAPGSNLFLAGDWTDTGWPATMESAAISGFRCAEAILKGQQRQQGQQGR